jgi:hypothetical protein
VAWREAIIVDRKTVGNGPRPKITPLVVVPQHNELWPAAAGRCSARGFDHEVDRGAGAVAAVPANRDINVRWTRDARYS